MTDYLFDEIKNLFLTAAEEIDRGNTHKQVPILIKFLNLLEELAGEEGSFDQVTLAQDLEDFDADDFGSEDYLDQKEEDPGWIEGTLHRQLKGGILAGQEIYVPERSIREFGFEDGDLIRAKSQGIKHMGTKTREFYYFDLLAKGDDQESKREEVNFAQVLWNDELGQYYILGEEDGEKVEIPLKDEDVDSLYIQENDRIEYAYWQGEIFEGRVAWKYSLNGPVVEKPAQGSRGQDGALDGMDVVLAVDLGREKPFREELNRLGANLVSLEDLNQAYRENRTLLADCALVLYDQVAPSHFERLRKKLQYDNIPTIYIGQLEAKDLYQVLVDNF